MILTQEASNFLGKNRAARQERKATRKQIRQERKTVRKEARQLRRSGDKTGARELKKDFRSKAKMLRKEKGMGLLGALGIRKPSENPSIDEAQIKLNNAESPNQETTSVTTAVPVSEPTNQNVMSAGTGNVSTSFGSSSGDAVASSNQVASESPQDEEEEEEQEDTPPKKKSKKWLWIGGGIAVLAIAIVLFFVLKNRE